MKTDPITAAHPTAEGADSNSGSAPTELVEKLGMMLWHHTFCTSHLFLIDWGFPEPPERHYPSQGGLFSLGQRSKLTSVHLVCAWFSEFALKVWGEAWVITAFSDESMIATCQDHTVCFSKPHHISRPSLIYSWKSQRWDVSAAFYYYHYYKPPGKKHTRPFTRGKHMHFKWFAAAGHLALAFDTKEMCASQVWVKLDETDRCKCPVESYGYATVGHCSTFGTGFARTCYQRNVMWRISWKQASDCFHL